MTYSKTSWTETTPINVTNLNNLETQYDEALSWAKSYGLGSTAKDVGNTDWNNHITTGFYMGDSMLNRPPYESTPHSWDYAIVVQHNSSYAIQTVTDFDNTETWQRVYHSGAWQAWKRIMFDSDVSYPVTSVNSKTGAVSLTYSDVDSQNKIAVYKNADGTQIDPNTTTESYILTQHSNNPPESGYFHIQTFFYSSETGNRAQIAIRYDGADSMYFRRYNTSWSTWKKLSDSDHTHTPSEIGAVNKKGDTMTGDLDFNSGSDGVILEDRNTGVQYRLAIVDAKLYMEEV